MRAVVAFVLGFSFSTMALSAGTAFGQERFHQWSDNTGRFKVDAEFVRVEGEQVVLKRLDGREIKIPFERLSPESLDLAKSKGGMGTRPKSSGSSKKEKPSNDKPADDVFGASKPSGDTKASKPSRTPVEEGGAEEMEGASTSSQASPVVQFSDGLSADEFVSLVLKELSEENTIVLWDALPSSMQSRTENLVVAFSKRVDSKSFDTIRRLRNTLIEILRKQQPFIVNSKVLQIPPEMASNLREAFPDGVDFLDKAIAKELLDSKRLQRGDLRGLLDNYLRNVNASAKKLIVHLPPDSPARLQFEETQRKGAEIPKYALKEISSDAVLQCRHRQCILTGTKVAGFRRSSSRALIQRCNSWRVRSI